MVDHSETVARLRRSFKEGKTKSYESRIAALLQLRRLLKDNQAAICAAIHQDIRRCEQEAICYEFIFIYNDIETCLKELKSWMKAQPVERNLLQTLDTAYTIPEPLGVVLVLGNWNYPIQVSLLPAVGAIAAGNCVIVKPSELASHTATILAELMPKYLDTNCYTTILGGAKDSANLLNERFDHIFFTGSGQVGKEILRRASDFLTPVTLELGGKSPAIVDTDCDVPKTAKRLAWGKFLSCGQTCLAPDYLICVESVKQQLIDEMIKYIRGAYGDDCQKSPDYPRIIDRHHFDRLVRLLSGGRILYGGNYDREDLYFQPTLVDAVKLSDPIMTEEIFGPILPILTVKSIAEATEFINRREKPLALYIFSRDKRVVQTVIDSTYSGGVTVNDCILHLTLHSLPFGGVGASGMGSYHGHFSFKTFSHDKPVLHRHQRGEGILWMRYPPYDSSKSYWAQFITSNRTTLELWLIKFVPLFILGFSLGYLIKQLG